MICTTKPPQTTKMSEIPSNVTTSTDSALAAYYDALAQATKYQSISNVKTVKQALELEKKRSKLERTRQKLLLHRTRIQWQRRDKAEKDRNEARESIIKRRREYIDYVDDVRNSMQMKMVDERSAHLETCYDCEVERTNKEVRMATKYILERNQKRAELAEAHYQNRVETAAIDHAIRMHTLQKRAELEQTQYNNTVEAAAIDHALAMSKIHESIERRKMHLDLANKYGAKLPPSVFDVKL
jgi:hypothetical protein